MAARILRSNSCSGGAIVLTTTAAHTAEIDGTVESVGSRSGDGSGKPGGGTITIIAGCSIDVSDTGLVSSRGRDPGADLVHLEGCTVSIHGIVESTRGKGNGQAAFLLNGGSTLTENKAIANGTDGFHLQSSGFSPSKNISGGTGSGYPNGGCQFLFDVAGNTNAGGNTSNGVTLAAGCF